MKLTKIISACLALCLVGSAVPFAKITASAEVVASGVCFYDDSLGWEFDDMGTLTIFCNEDKNYWVSDWLNFGLEMCEEVDIDDVKSLIIGQGATCIDCGCFADYKNLETVQFPEGFEGICENGFMGCLSLQSIVLPKTTETLALRSFASCSNLESITILNPNCLIQDWAICNQYEPIVTFSGTIHGYPNSTAQAYAEKYGYKFEPIDETPTEDTIFGDLNGDGDLTVADVIEFSQRLSSRQGLPKNCDLNSDNVVNVIDLALLKKALLNK